MLTRQRPRNSSSRIATPRVRPALVTTTVASTAVAHGCDIRTDPISNTGRVGTSPRALRARAERFARVTSRRNASSLNQRTSCSGERTPASTSRAARTILRTNCSGSGRSDAGAASLCAGSAIPTVKPDRTHPERGKRKLWITLVTRPRTALKRGRPCAAVHHRKRVVRESPRRASCGTARRSRAHSRRQNRFGCQSQGTCNRCAP